MNLKRLLPLAIAPAFLCAAANASTIFNFDNVTLGTETNFTNTVNGLSANFSSSADPGGFVVFPSIFATLTGNVLGDPGPAGKDNLSLDVSFSQVLSSLSLDFATADFNTPSQFTVSAYDNSTYVGSISAAGMFITGSKFPEAAIDFSGAAFNNVVISSTAPDFAVDNLNATVAPEPSAWVLLTAGLLLMGISSLRRKSIRQSLKSAALTTVSLMATLAGTLASAQTTQSIFPLLPPSVSTVPSNGDVNPYGVVIAPKTVAMGALQPGDILVSNFNNSNNLQGTGSTVVRVDMSGNVTTFFTAPANQSGLSAAIGVLSDGVVLVGNLPTADGTSATAQPGRLAVLNGSGQFLGTFGNSNTVDGPWGMAIADNGNGVSGTAHVFLSNVLSGVVSRIDITYTATSLSATDLVLASGFNHRSDPAALELGPAGLVYSATNDTLYVTSSVDNAVYEIPTATQPHSTPVAATLFFQDSTHLHGPLDIGIIPDGHFLIANSDGSNVDPNQPSELVEYSATGQFLNQMSVDPNNGGAFGLASSTIGWGTIRLVAVDDNSNRLNIWTTVVP